MSLRTLAPLVLLLLSVGAGCSKADVSMQNDLRGVPGAGKAGGVDDSIKPKGPAPVAPALTPVVTPVVGRTGGSDDSIKPKPTQLPAPQPQLKP